MLHHSVTINLMLKIVKIGSGVVGTGVIAGLGVVGWMYLNPANETAARLSGKPVVLDTSITPAPTLDSGLQVAGPSSVAANGGNSDSLLGGTARKQEAPSRNSLPGPSEFKQYEAHRDKPTALYIDVIPGTGKDVAVGSIANVMYRGWLTDGTMFDENYSSRKAFTFKEGENKVIPGLEEGMFGMKAGGKRRVLVPASRGYGSTVKGPIPANSMLIFDIELLKVE